MRLVVGCGLGAALLAIGCGRSEFYGSASELEPVPTASASSAGSSGSASGGRTATGTSTGSSTGSSAGTSAGSSVGTSSGNTSAGSSQGASSTGGNSSSSTGTSGTSGTSGGQPVCLTKLYNPGQFCTGDCPAPLTCAADPLFGNVCASLCHQTSDCDYLGAVCIRGACVINLCGPGTGNGTFNSVCNASGTNDGTCTPYLQTFNGSPPVGLCVQGGGSTACCDGSCIDRQHLNQSCAAGMVCHNGACGVACDPEVGTTCNQAAACIFTSSEPPAGVCPPADSKCP